MAMMSDAEQPQLYPVRLWMEYPERLSRLTTFFRVILAIPVFLFLYLLQANIVVAIWITILVRGRIPRWLFDFEVGLNRFISRAAAYFLLLSDKYPAFEGDWELQYTVHYPERLSRWKLLFWKFFSAIPHIIVLFALMIAVWVVTIIAWFAILFTGNYPRGLHSFVVGVLRWGARVTAYVESLTDAFPPFSLNDHAGPGTQEVLFGIIGAVVAGLLIAAGVGIGIAVYQISTDATTKTVDYEDALAGNLTPDELFIEKDLVGFFLTSGVDDATYDVLSPREGNRMVEFSVGYQNVRNDRQREGYDVESNTLRLRTDEDGSVSPVLLTIDGYAAPENVEQGPTYVLRAIFEIGEDDTVLELRGYPTNAGRHVAWKFE